MILHGAADKDPITGALSVPIYSASTYHQKNIYKRQEFDYSRSGNPTRKALEQVLAVLEDGSNAYAFSSGIAAITATLTAVLKNGDHVVVTQDIYGGTYRLLTQYLNKFGISHTFVDTTNINSVEKAIQQNTKALFLESPSNPLLKIIDFDSMVRIAKKHKLVSMVDNTFLSPYFFQPLKLGIDISIHSATKFLGGHSDLIGGAVITGSSDLGELIYFVQNSTGNMISPENAWLLLRGTKTLSVRMKFQSENALILAKWLQKQSWVTKVFYPGLSDHVDHDIISKQASGYGAIVSFTTETVERAHKIMNSVKIWTVAVSLGAVESILSYPSLMSHATFPKNKREELGITDNLIRLSVGLEDIQDLISDLS